MTVSKLYACFLYRQVTIRTIKCRQEPKEPVVEPSNQSGKRRWGQDRRLEFIDARLQFDGRINRSDLIKFFDISTPQASADLGRYQTMAPANIRYDPRGRMYIALPEFQPLFGGTAATGYLDEIHRLARKVVEPEESFVGFVPSTGVVATPARAIEAEEVAIIVRAIRDRSSLRIRYQSMNHPAPIQYVISPHALGFDGLRWHVRAWCHTRKLFHDFAIGRLEIEGPEHEITAVDPKLDLGWTTIVGVVLIPHPKLSPHQRKVVIRDYGMNQGRLVLMCQKAMLFYTLRHLNLEELSVMENPARQHVVIQNRDEVARWIQEDRPCDSGVPRQLR